MVAGVLSSLIGLVQVFAPNLPDGDWIAVSAIAGRATGNLRQPNHSEQPAALVGGGRDVARRERAPCPAGWPGALALVFIEVIVLSASRTGLLGMFVLTAWGVLDRRLAKPGPHRPARWRPWPTWPSGAITGAWAHATHMAFGGGERLSGSGLYVSYSRYKIWWNSLALIAAHPLARRRLRRIQLRLDTDALPRAPGRLLRPRPQHRAAVRRRARPADGHAGAGPHGLRAVPRHRRTPSPMGACRRPSAAGAQRAALVMVLMAGVHSLLEYPLWYSYFLLPAAFAFGLCLERPQPAAGTSGDAPFGTPTSRAPTCWPRC